MNGDAGVREILSAADDHEPGLHELDATERSLIAAIWLRYFDGTA
ncbi:MAG: hypothetical protein ACRDXB_15960 [Actinomycetes bacterium]